MRGSTDPARSPSWRLIALGGVTLALGLAAVETCRIVRPPMPSVAELADARPAVRIEALARLGDLWPAAARLAPLLPDIVVGDPDPAVRQAAREALDSLRGPALKWYVRLLEDVEAERLPAVAERTREFDRLGVRLGGLLEAVAETSPEQPELMLLGLPWEVPDPVPPPPHVRPLFELALLERWASAPRTEHEGLAAGLVLVASGEARLRALTQLVSAEGDLLTLRLMALLGQTRHPPWMGWSVSGVLAALASPAPNALARVERSLPASGVRSLKWLKQGIQAFWGVPDEGQELSPLSATVTEALADARVPDSESEEGKELDAHLVRVSGVTRWTHRGVRASRPILLDVLRALREPQFGGSVQSRWVELALRALTKMPPLDAEGATIVEALQTSDDDSSPLQAPFRLALLAMSERARPKDVHALLDRLDALERTENYTVHRPSWDRDLQRAVLRLLHDRADLAIQGDILSRLAGPGGKAYMRLAILDGLASLAPGPARDAAIALVASGKLAWLEADLRGEAALAQAKLRHMAVETKGAIDVDIATCMSVLEALRVWGAASGVQAQAVAAMRDSLNPRLAWRAHWAYRALGGT